MQSPNRGDSPHPHENKAARETRGRVAEFVCLSLRERAQHCHVLTDVSHTRERFAEIDMHRTQGEKEITNPEVEQTPLEWRVLNRS